MHPQIMRFGLIFSAIFLAAFGQIILKIGMEKNGQLSFTIGHFIKAFTNPVVLGGLAFYGVSLLIWLVVLSREELSFVYPMVAFAYVITTVLAVIFLHESVPPLRWIGLSIIIVGIICIAKS